MEASAQFDIFWIKIIRTLGVREIANFNIFDLFAIFKLTTLGQFEFKKLLILMFFELRVSGKSKFRKL